MNRCNCHSVCKLEAAIKLGAVLHTKKVLENRFFQYWAESKNQKEAIGVADITDNFLDGVEIDLIIANRNFDKAFANPFRAIELY